MRQDRRQDSAGDRSTREEGGVDAGRASGVASQGPSSALRGHRYESAKALQRTGGGDVPAVNAPQGPLDAMAQAATALAAAHGEQISRGAEAIAVPARSVAAVVLAEQAGLGPLDAGELAVRFEPHAFWQQTGRWVVATHRDQAAERAAFAAAQRIDADAAHAATRMGLGQLAGSEASAAGFANAEAMMAAMRESPQAQIEGLLAVFAGSAQLQAAANDGAWEELAALRAGPAWVALGYHDALAAGAAAWDDLRQAEPAPQGPATTARGGHARGGGDDGGEGGEGGGDGDPRRRARKGAASGAPAKGGKGRS